MELELQGRFFRFLGRSGAERVCERGNKGIAASGAVGLCWHMSEEGCSTWISQGFIGSWERFPPQFPSCLQGEVTAPAAAGCCNQPSHVLFGGAALG